MSKRKNYMFIHQNMPGQFLHLSRHLRDQGHRVVFLTQNKANRLQGVTKVNYVPHREVAPQTHVYLKPTEMGVLNGQAVFKAVVNLQKDGFKPDIVVGHCGWGETLFVKDALPDVPLLNYYEFFYRENGQDLGFDPEYKPSPDTALSLKLKNTVNLMCLHTGDWGITPTRWQLSGYPAHHRDRISVIHDGIDTDEIRPNTDATLELPGGKVLKAGEKIVTFVSRSLEPYRGFHIFVRAIPEIQRRHPDAEIVIVGAEGVSYGQRLPEGDSYKKRMLAEVTFDESRVHFMGHLKTPEFRAALQVSAAHIYLTYPFVLSWSMLEAMATGCLVIGSRTQPVEELITDGQNGLLVDFFDVQGLAAKIDGALSDTDAYRRMREAARNTIVARYDLRMHCLPRQLALIEDLITSRGRI